MAILADYQGNNLGSALIKHAEIFLQSRSIRVLWFNVRENAVKFYQKKGYKIIVDSFNIPKIGPHFTMFKTLQ